MRVYAWIGGDRPSEVAAKERVAEGYSTLKMNAPANTEWIDSALKIQESAAMVGTVRDAVGWNVGIGIDFHGRVHKNTG
jgi:galactonate dehydratase